MRAESAIKPPVSLGFSIEQTAESRCNIHFYKNIEQTEKENGDILYSYDLYSLENIPYHENLKNNIKANKTAWIQMAIDKENADPEYTEQQLLEQDITDLMLDNIEQGQQITELELLILGGNL